MNINDNEQSCNTQNAKIIDYMEKGNKITQIEALNLFGCFRLASRIHDIRSMGYNVKAEKVTTHTGKKICQYSLVS
jgi:hypothetical protein